MKAILQIIEIIQAYADKTEVEVKMLYLQNGDAASIANILLQTYGRVLILPNGTILRQGTALGGAAGGIGGAGGANKPNSCKPTPPYSSRRCRVSTRFLIAAPKSRMSTVEEEVQKLDVPVPNVLKAQAFHLERTPAARVGQLIQNYWANRYAPDTNLIHITWDDASNTVFVQAAPADLVEIKEMIEKLDRVENKATNDIKIIRLKNAVSDTLANLLYQSLSQTIVQNAVATGGTRQVRGPQRRGLSLPHCPRPAASARSRSSAAVIPPRMSVFVFSPTQRVGSSRPTGSRMCISSPTPAPTA